MWVFLLAYTCSGLAGLIYEVSWTRLLTLYIGHTTAAASAVVAAFMGGLAIGAAGGGRLVARLTPRQCHRTQQPARVFLEFATEFVAVALRKTMDKEDPSIPEIKLFMHDLSRAARRAFSSRVDAGNPHGLAKTSARVLSCRAPGRRFAPTGRYNGSLWPVDAMVTLPVTLARCGPST